MEWGKSTSHIYYVPFTQSENIVPSPQPVDWAEGTGERVQHPGLGKVQQDPRFNQIGKWHIMSMNFK